LRIDCGGGRAIRVGGNHSIQVVRHLLVQFMMQLLHIVFCGDGCRRYGLHQQSHSYYKSNTSKLVGDETKVTQNMTYSVEHYTCVRVMTIGYSQMSGWLSNKSSSPSLRQSSIAALIVPFVVATPPCDSSAVISGSRMRGIWLALPPGMRSTMQFMHGTKFPTALFRPDAPEPMFHWRASDGEEPLNAFASSVMFTGVVPAPSGADRI